MDRTASNNGLNCTKPNTKLLSENGFFEILINEGQIFLDTVANETNTPLYTYSTQPELLFFEPMEEVLEEEFETQSEILNTSPIKFYAVETNWGGKESSSEYIDKEIWDYEHDEESVIEISSKIKEDDMLILKETFSYKKKPLSILAIGIVKENLTEKRVVKVLWKKTPTKNSYFHEINTLDKYDKTISQISSAEEINSIFSHLPQHAKQIQSLIDEKNKHEKIIELEQITSISYEPENDVLESGKIANLFVNMILKSGEKVNAKGERKLREEQFYGIFGRWGRGKTYLWKLIKKIALNDHKNKLVPVEFHAWKYQDTPATWAYLFETLVNKYYNKPNYFFLSPVKYFKYLYRVAKLNFYRHLLVWPIVLAFSYALTLFFVFNLETLKYTLAFVASGAFSIYATYETFINTTVANTINQLKQVIDKPSFKSHLGLQHEIEKELIALLKAWIIGKQHILLFIDDIDRCDENKIIEIVDSIRVMLHNFEIADKIVAIAAIDERILSRAIQLKYKTENESEGVNPSGLAREYMDKLFITGIKLSPLTSIEKGNVLKAFLGSKIKKIAKEVTEPILDQKNKIIEDTETISAPSKVSDFAFDFESQIIVSETIVANYELTEVEYQALELNIKKYEGATPRLIRSYGIRYRLGKNLINLLYKKGSEEYDSWHNEDSADRIVFAALLLDKMKDPTLNLKNKKQAQKSLDKINTVLDMIVPY